MVKSLQESSCYSAIQHPQIFLDVERVSIKILDNYFFKFYEVSLCCQQHYTSRSLFGSSSCVAKNDDAATITDYNYKVISLFVLYADFVHCSWKKKQVIGSLFVRVS